MKCDNCGAEVASEGVRCEYCDSAVAREENHASAATTATIPSADQRTDRRADVFEQIKQSAVYAQRNSRNRHNKLPSVSGIAMLAPVIFFAVFICMARSISSATLILT